jgi:preprotein translocase subunit YajC
MPSSIFSCGGTTADTTTTTTQSTTDTAATQGSWTSWIFPIAILVVFVLLIIVPQKRRDKKVKDMLSRVRVGDRVKTIGGVYGTVVGVKEDLVTIETGSEKTKIVFAKGAIATVEAAEVEAPDLKN